MVKRSSLDQLFHALAHDARRDMLERLAVEDLTIGALVEPVRMSFPAASKHVRVLESAGLIERTVEGRRHRCQLRPTALEPAGAWLEPYEHYWMERLDALEDVVTRSGER